MSRPACPIRSDRDWPFAGPFFLGLWLVALGLSFPADAAEEQPKLILTSVSRIRLLSPEEAARNIPVLLRGVVTLVDPAGAFWFLQDETGGIYVDTRDPKRSFQPGDLVEVTAVTGAGDFAPIIRMPAVRVLGKTDQPKALTLSVDELMRGTYDSQWVAVSGIVRTVGRHEGWLDLEVASPGGRVPIWVAGGTNTDLPLSWINAQVRVFGVCGTEINRKRQLTGIRLMVPSAVSVEVLSPAPAEPFSLPVQPVSHILKFTPPGLETHLVRIHGVATLSRKGQGFYLQDRTAGVYVRTRDAVAIKPGDLLDVVGFPVASPQTPNLEDAVSRRLAQGRSVTPVKAAAKQLYTGELDSLLVRLTGLLVDQVENDLDHFLYVQEGARVFEVALENAFDHGSLDHLKRGSRLEIVGVYTTQFEEDRRRQSFRILLRSPADVRVLSAPSWWTLRRTFQAIGLLVSVTVASLAWVMLLRRRVRYQTRIIQEEFQREEALEKRCRELVDNAVDMVFTLDLQGKLLMLNSSGEKLVGMPRTEAVQTPLADLVAPDDRRVFAEWFQACLAGDTHAACEVDLITPQGNRISVDIRGRQVSPYEQSNRIEGIARNVTDRKKAEQQIRQLSLAVEQSPASIVITNVAGDIEYVNPKFTEISGYTFEEVKGKNPRILKSGEMPSEAYQQMWATIAAGNEWRGEFHNRKKNGELYWEAAAITSVRNAQGNIMHFLGIKEDITQRKQLEIEREKLIRELREALSKVKTLSGLLPICASCKKIRDDKGYWNQLESFLAAHADVWITHGICPDCMKKLYPEFSVSRRSPATKTHPP